MFAVRSIFQRKEKKKTPEAQVTHRAAAGLFPQSPATSAPRCHPVIGDTVLKPAGKRTQASLAAPSETAVSLPSATLLPFSHLFFRGDFFFFFKAPCQAPQSPSGREALRLTGSPAAAHASTGPPQHMRGPFLLLELPPQHTAKLSTRLLTEALTLPQKTPSQVILTAQLTEQPGAGLTSHGSTCLLTCHKAERLYTPNTARCQSADQSKSHCHIGTTQTGQRKPKRGISTVPVPLLPPHLHLSSSGAQQRGPTF